MSNTILVIGAGVMGENHIRVLTSTLISKLVTIVAMDSNKARLSEISKKYNIETFDSYTELYGKYKPNYVIIATPICTHSTIAKHFMIHKVRRILIEKPVANSREEALSLIKFSKRYKAHVYVGHIERFNPVIIAIKAFLNDNNLGIREIVCKRLGKHHPRIRDTGVTKDLAIHDIDIINYLTYFRRIRRYVSKLRYGLKTRFDDELTAYLEFPFFKARLFTSWIADEKVREITIKTDRRYMIFGDLLNQRCVVTDLLNNKERVLNLGKTEEPLKVELYRFLTDCKGLCNLEEATVNIGIAECLLKKNIKFYVSKN